MTLYHQIFTKLKHDIHSSSITQNRHNHKAIIQELVGSTKTYLKAERQDHRNGIDLLKLKFLGSGRRGALQWLPTRASAGGQGPCFKLKFSAIFYSNFFDLRPSFSNSEKTSEQSGQRTARRDESFTASPARGMSEFPLSPYKGIRRNLWRYCRC